MSTFKKFLLIVGTMGLGIAGTWAVAFSEDQPTRYGFGKEATLAEIEAWNIDVSPSGEGLPPGLGTVRQGAEVFAAKCATCHGPNGTEGPRDRLVGGQNTLKRPRPIKTVGSYWPYATTLYDYTYRAMPFDEPGSLEPDEVYSLVAFILHMNELIEEDVVIDKNSLPEVAMPARDRFVPDDRTGGPELK